MISVILYGRNDNYGYNLHKRAALSLNSIAEVLRDKSDEIVFVDYNTPDDLPTFPEAIADTLTTRARERLRVLRVRPNIHERFRSKTHLVALEPIARNVGVRRSEPSNRWILSTNTDLVFVTKKQESLNEVVQSLPGGLYHTPRIEIPEALWESLDRKNPRAAIQSIRKWGWTLHLNEIVYGNEIILYDGPGDFQLLERQQLFDIHGFNEEMLLGWHVDSNLAKRMQLLFGAVGDLGSRVYAYHCDHTRQATPMHSHVRIENDWQRFVADLVRADIPEQANDWGCAQDEIEEIRLGAGQARVHVDGLQQAIGKQLREPLVAHYKGGSTSGANYAARHVVPFLIDLLCSYPKNAVVGWCGTRIDTLRIFTRAWSSLGFERPVLVDNSLVDPASFATVLDTRLVSSETLWSRATVFVFDFGTDTGTAASHNQDNVAKTLLELVNIERRRFSEGVSLRKIATIGAINNEYEKLVARHVGAGYVPFSTRIRHGYVLLPFHGEQNWLPAFQPGEAGIRDGRFLGSREAQIGVVGHGAYKHLPTGRYRLNVEFELNDNHDSFPIDSPCVAVELRSSFNLFAVHALTLRDLKSSQALLFDVPGSIGSDIESTIEVRLLTVERVAFTVRSLTVESVNAVPLVNSILRISNWLPFLIVGPTAHRGSSGVIANTGNEGYIVTGPYWPLLPGWYELDLSLEALQAPGSLSEDEGLGSVEVAIEAKAISSAPIRPRDLALGRLRLLFAVPIAPEDKARPLVETRIWTSGKIMFRIRSIAVLQQHETDVLLPLRAEQNWLSALEPNEAGTRLGRAIISWHSQIGIVAIGTHRNLPSGKYQLNVDFATADGASYLPPDEPCIQIELRSSAQLFAIHFLKVGDLRNPPSIVFDVPNAVGDNPDRDIELRVAKIRPITLAMQKLAISPVTSFDVVASILRIGNWLPFLNVESSRRRHDGVVEAKRGRDGHIVFGPYWPLSPGRYAMLAVLESLEPLDNVDDGECLALADVAINATAIAITKLGPWELARKRIRLNFEVPAVVGGNLPSLIETRIWTAGKVALNLSSVSVRPWLEEDDAIDIQPGPVGRWDGNVVRERSSTLGCIAYCQLPFGLGSGPQRFRLDYETIDDLVQGPADQICLRVELHRGGQLLKAQDLRRDELNRIKDFVFEIPRPTADKADVAFEFRVVSGAPISVKIAGLSIESAIHLENWLPFLRPGPAGKRVSSGIAALTGMQGYVFDGPYWPLQPGRYEASAKILLSESATNPADDVVPAVMEIAANTHRFIGINVGRRQFLTGEIKLFFELPPATRTSPPSIEIRMWTSGHVPFHVQSVTVRPCNQAIAVELEAGETGEWDHALLYSSRSRSGCVAVGTSVFNLPWIGPHRLNIDWVLQEAVHLPDEACALIELHSNDRLFAVHVATPADLARTNDFVFNDLARTKEFLFNIPTALAESGSRTVQVRIVTLKPLALTIQRLWIEPAGTTKLQDTMPRLENWLSVLRPAEVGERFGRAIKSEKGFSGYVLDGPYWPLAAGRYELVATIDIDEVKSNWPDDVIFGIVDIAVNTHQLTKSEIRSAHLKKGGLRLIFDVPPAGADGIPPLVESRVWTAGHAGLVIRSMVVRNV